MANGWTRFWGRVGGWLAKAFDAAQRRGLTDQLIDLAVMYVRQYADRARTDEEKAAAREAIVQILVKQGVRESLARLAVELAVGLVKDEPAPAS
jgi:hypothetical protein